MFGIQSPSRPRSVGSTRKSDLRSATLQAGPRSWPARHRTMFNVLTFHVSSPRCQLVSFENTCDLKTYLLHSNDTLKDCIVSNLMKPIRKSCEISTCTSTSINHAYLLLYQSNLLEPENRSQRRHKPRS